MRLSVTLLLGAALLTGVGLASPTASASPTLTVSPTTSLLAPPNATTALTGLAVSGDTTDTLQATVATTLGTVSISLTTNLTLAFGNSWSGTASITFTGRQADIDAALDSAALTTGGTTATADISLTALVAQPGFDYLAANQHFYEYVPCAACSWFSADADAQALSLDGQPGYLATIPNATVNSFISTKIANATNVWFGARAYESLATDGTQADAVVNGVTYARVWRWTEGAGESPIAGGVISECTNQLTTCSFQNAGSLYSSWASGEPNNDSGSTTVAYVGEYAAVTNWNGTSGDWNDLNPTDDSSVSGYVAEFGGKTNSDASLGTGFAGVVTTTAGVLVAASASVPSAPVVTAVAGDAAATLSWNPPATNGAAITGYEVSTDGGVTWHAVATTTATTVANGNAVVTVTATVSGLTDGTTYSVEVRADNSAGPSVASTPRSVTPVDLVRTGGSTAATPAGAGYWNLLPGGTLSAHGNADLLGSENGASLAAPVVGVCSTITGDGYWETASDGGVFSFGDAHFYGALPPTTPAAPVVAMTRTPDGGGYWLVGADGGVFSFGDASFYGSLGATALRAPIVGIAGTPSGHGYWLAAADGGVFAFGDATFYGSVSSVALRGPIVGITTTPSGDGYWLVGHDGGVFSFGDASFYGSLGGTGFVPVTGMVADDDLGYRLIGADGSAYPFGTTS